MINLKENEFLAIKVSQPFGEFYSVKLNADFLLERSFSKTADFYGKDISGGQRSIRKARLNEISDFIDSDEASFPNSIIVAANYDEDDIRVSEDISWTVTVIDEKLSLYKIRIPSDDKVCSIVDGQHRLFAFEQSRAKKIELTCSIYLDLIPSLQASVFATINFNQKPVDKSLAYNLFGYQLDNLESKHWSPDLLAVNLCRHFAETEGSFFYSHINYRLKTRNVKQGDWVISTASFVDGVISLISSIAGIFYQGERIDIILRGITRLQKNERWFKRKTMNSALSELLVKVSKLNQLPANQQQQSISLPSLTRRENTIIGLVSRGAKNQEIADQLHISPNTVKTHLYSIFRKTQSRNRIELISRTQDYLFTAN
ncbi:DGQHR domain-containing protein [Colwellia sp. BRX8-8]|nr:DGQHR domain-containing protein [Colwellia sp. BRX8-8]